MHNEDQCCGDQDPEVAKSEVSEARIALKRFVALGSCQARTAKAKKSSDGDKCFLLHVSLNEFTRNELGKSKIRAKFEV